MKNKFEKKYVFSVIAAAVVAVVAGTYSLLSAGPFTAHAQTPAVQTSVQDGEVKDDSITTKSSPTLQQKADTSENDTIDTGTTPEKEDGN